MHLTHLLTQVQALKEQQLAKKLAKKEVKAAKKAEKAAKKASKGSKHENLPPPPPPQRSDDAQPSSSHHALSNGHRHDVGMDSTRDGRSGGDSHRSRHAHGTEDRDANGRDRRISRERQHHSSNGHARSEGRSDRPGRHERPRDAENGGAAKRQRRSRSGLAVEHLLFLL